MEKSYNYARDAFIYLLSYATLLIVAVALNFLTKALIGRVIPDVAEVGDFMHDDRTIIGFLAALIIAFPIFWYISWRANKMLAKSEMKPNTGVRLWLIYITLVVVILVIIAQLIALFLTFLQGAVGLRVLLGALVTIAIAVSILMYQWWHLRAFGDKPLWPKSWFKIFEWKALILVAAVVVWAFASVGSPSAQRAKRFDEMRTERLRSIQWAVEDFYGLKDNINFGRLPNALEELQANKRYFIDEESLIDPKTGEGFEYRPLSATSYELCAVFETASDADSTVPRLPEESGKILPFEHEAGRTCFELSVK
ncbi:MAG: DUF5671 domain-containing protein [Patescibacteria group bacterium]|nr:DUF5671 domain-containing protein [Patescibacteria group bacterium]